MDVAGKTNIFDDHLAITANTSGFLSHPHSMMVRMTQKPYLIN